MKIIRNIRNAIMKLMDSHYKWRCKRVSLGNKVKMRATDFIGKGGIKIGNRVSLGYFPSPYADTTRMYLEARDEDVAICIDDETYINNNASIIAAGASIHIGKHCLIGANFQCYSSDFHSLDPRYRLDSKCAESREVIIGNNVFVGNNVIILKGVELGEGCCVGAGAVVTKSFPAYSIIGGNPAVFIKSCSVNAD